MNKKDERHFNEEFERLMYKAYILDGEAIHTGEALLLACLLHAKGNRNSNDLIEVQKIMYDRNLK